MIAADPPALPEFRAELLALKASLQVDLAAFRRDVGWRLPSALEAVSVSEVRQHLGPFLEHTFRAWAERENAEIQRALAAIAERALPCQGLASGPDEITNGPDSRLFWPSFEVSTFALDVSVVAALALGVGTLFANAAVGGLFLLAAPTLASLGRDRGERALRQRAAEAAMKSIDEAAAKLGLELERVIDEFGRRVAPSTS